MLRTTFFSPSVFTTCWAASSNVQDSLGTLWLECSSVLPGSLFLVLGFSLTAARAGYFVLLIEVLESPLWVMLNRPNVCFFFYCNLLSLLCCSRVRTAGVHVARIWTHLLSLSAADGSITHLAHSGQREGFVRASVSMSCFSSLSSPCLPSLRQRSWDFFFFFLIPSAACHNIAFEQERGPTSLTRTCILLLEITQFFGVIG